MPGRIPGWEREGVSVATAGTNRTATISTGFTAGQDDQQEIRHIMGGSRGFALDDDISQDGMCLTAGTNKMKKWPRGPID
jgi:hypothetical protein